VRWGTQQIREFKHDSDSGKVETQLAEALWRMELLLVNEMERWEEYLWANVQKFVGRDDVLVKGQVFKEWKAGFRRRLETDMRAIDSRMDAASLQVKVANIHSDELSRKWQSVHDAINEPSRTSPSGFLEARQALHHSQTRPVSIASRLKCIAAHRTSKRSLDRSRVQLKANDCENSPRGRVD
jgi:hypothetical protein